MKIKLLAVTPAPLAGVIDLNTQIWERHLSFEKGRNYKVYAPSGKGKSTFINILYGLRKDYTGEVLIDEKNIQSFSDNEWAQYRQDRISIIFQDLRLFLNLSALDNIKVKSVLHKEVTHDHIKSMAEFLGVDSLLDKPASILSYGERQRIAIIRSLVQPFDMLLLDEPFSHLDKENSKLAADLISIEVKKRNAGMIVSSLGHEDGFLYDEEFRL